MSMTETDAPAADPIIRCVGLQKWYGAVHALKNVDFHAERGEVIGLVGDNGAGKSTLIKILSGVHMQDQGAIFIEGREVAITGPEVAMALGIETIYQYTAMVPEMTIAQNFFIGREPLKAGILGIGLLDQARMRAESIQAIAAAVIGGVALSGGVGSILGAVIGTLLIAVIENILILSGVNANWFMFAVGAMIVIAVVLNTQTRLKAERMKGPA